VTIPPWKMQDPTGALKAVANRTAVKLWQAQASQDWISIMLSKWNLSNDITFCQVVLNTWEWLSA
jgi:hypothetical protein